MTTGRSRSAGIQFLRFFASSAGGLVTDVVLFQALLLLGLDPWLANAISSAAAITVVYLLATRYAFGTETRWLTYAVFFGWYAGIVVAVSLFVQAMTTATDLPAIVWKLASIPVSFVLNYLFSRFLLTRVKKG